MKEEYLLTGELEPTNEPYAVSKIAGIKMCQSYNRQYGTDFISVMPTNLYGPNDNFDLNSSHVLPAMIRKFHEAKCSMENGLPPKSHGSRNEVLLWGTGKPYRELLHVDDLADACVFLMNHYTGNDFVNIGAGKDITIRQLAEKIKAIVGFQGEILWDTTKPDGTPRKLLDVSRLNALGWQAKISLDDGIRQTYDWFINAEHKKMGGETFRKAGFENKL
jgi:GDP-L-fucose synthase